ncbi:MAG TPA: HypC/HybG/HupF family hydrogenase formation chaperone [Gammaproteobacteria bacterium]|nr:HypC/HybG/HupF family hydrogenase formation chaperone [Gammaproteobacteria bacterium]
MCVGVPVQVIESAECMARCYGRNGEEQVNMMLIGAQPVGTWLLNFLGSAREVISEQDAININKALDGLTAIMQGDTGINVDDYFPGLGSSER